MLLAAQLRVEQRHRPRRAPERHGDRERERLIRAPLGVAARPRLLPGAVAHLQRAVRLQQRVEALFAPLDERQELAEERLALEPVDERLLQRRPARARLVELLDNLADAAVVDLDERAQLRAECEQLRHLLHVDARLEAAPALAAAGRRRRTRCGSQRLVELRNRFHSAYLRALDLIVHPLRQVLAVLPSVCVDAFDVVVKRAQESGHQIFSGCLPWYADRVLRLEQRYCAVRLYHKVGHRVFSEDLLLVERTASTCGQLLQQALQLRVAHVCLAPLWDGPNLQLLSELDHLVVYDVGAVLANLLKPQCGAR